MAFMKDKLPEELRKQVLALAPALKKLRFENTQDGHYWDEFYHRRSHVRVKVVAVKEPKSYGSYAGFKLKLERGQHPGRGSNVVMVKIDNLAAVRTAIKDSIGYIRRRKESERTKASFKETLEKTLPRLFPGREAAVYTGSHGSLYVSMSGSNGKPSISFEISPLGGQIGEVKISYPGKTLEQVAKLLESW